MSDNHDNITNTGSETKTLATHRIVPEAGKEERMRTVWTLCFYTLPLDILIFFFNHFSKQLKHYSYFLQLSMFIALAICVIYLNKSWLSEKAHNIKGKIDRINKHTVLKSANILLIVAFLAIGLAYIFYVSEKNISIGQMILPIFVLVSTVISLMKAGKNITAVKTEELQHNTRYLHLLAARWISLSGVILSAFEGSAFEGVLLFLVALFISLLFLSEFKPEEKCV